MKSFTMIDAFRGQGADREKIFPCSAYFTIDMSVWGIAVTLDLMNGWHEIKAMIGPFQLSVCFWRDAV